MSDGSARPPRRTQEQRRETTRTALLDATIESLAEVGYTGTTTRAVAARAGLTHGAQQHHYGTKLALVDAALKRFAQTLAESGPAVQMGRPESTSVSEWDRCVELLDSLWEMHRRQPVVGVISEMLALSRTDPEIRERMAENSTIAHLIARSSTATALPGLARVDGFGEWVLTVLAAMRGLLMLQPLGLQGEAGQTWDSMRDDLLAALRSKAAAQGVVV
ncbi:Transcriptional regulator, TetR family OS=Tsukamurella paurometabola (strain ATCC 8368 / DSM/ CCUG 35730 / CIP 100753 / JCM 10117 / KCTC 9821 / NBRC 16120/ NCIMB 702349 / NCTC 13040) OX=521096 GN=Tpau_2258 PE=4 SV=1 [Tsukamurella paurometabola]|uniref:Transcriptional regulator, TetR family n=1 Tax=Tsukamurella paurometabola (strain ATCC 8368 / DSM 20162 / CCUG 35730 / CIP 100753 / JCM 10117 / KCTC 9821 / NBRC 16120 / NCIMB 702349 / NCTC 13040) TaxID=521096 RepID=D5UQ97_TSUPD|nr:TetR/AcrR family transcriptional regulator [Tsukamurella paurometabola]ADG78867.1 transcriptional regulator, TetR family [Tsukamurella paurometabola DSM 20162]SUP33371.1 transcriptional regulator BetI [Tsukamurella paurometabola]